MARILIVEHDHDIRRLITILLEHMGHEIVGVADERLTPAYARMYLPCLIILDISPPGLDGKKIVQQIRADTMTAAIPLLALTAHAWPASIRAPELLGFDAVLLKPFDLALFYTQVTALLGAGVEHAREVGA